MPPWRNQPKAGKLADLVALGDRNPMVYVYVIKSLKVKYNYVGITNNIKRRFAQHNLGYNKSTKPFCPFKLILTETYENYIEAREREKFLKSGKGREYLKSLFI